MKRTSDDTGLDFLGVESMFGEATLTVLDDRFDYGERRFLTLGVIDGRVLAVAHSETDEVIKKGIEA